MVEHVGNNCICLMTFALLATCGASFQVILAFSYCRIEVCICLDDSSRPDRKGAGFARLILLKHKLKTNRLEQVRCKDLQSISCSPNSVHEDKVPLKGS